MAVLVLQKAKPDDRERSRGYASSKYAVNRDGDLFLVECPVCGDQNLHWHERNCFVCRGGAANGDAFTVNTEDGVVRLFDHRRGNIKQFPAVAVVDEDGRHHLGIAKDAPWWWKRREVRRDLRDGKDAHGHAPYRRILNPFGSEERAAQAGLSKGVGMPLLKARRLAYRTEFRGLPISIEQAPGEARHWTDPHTGAQGTTIFGLPYGYIRLTEGTDGDQVDVFLGPDETAPMVYVVTQMKAPEFRAVDEQKVMLGFRSEAEAREAYLQHYDDPRFLGWIDAMPFEVFREKVLATKVRPGLIRSRVGQGRRLGLRKSWIRPHGRRDPRTQRVLWIPEHFRRDPAYRELWHHLMHQHLHGMATSDPDYLEQLARLPGATGRTDLERYHGTLHRRRDRQLGRLSDPRAMEDHHLAVMAGRWPPANDESHSANNQYSRWVARIRPYAGWPADRVARLVRDEWEEERRGTPALSAFEASSEAEWLRHALGASAEEFRRWLQ